METTTPPTEETLTTEEQRVILWRARELLRAGYGVRGAIEVSARTDIDLHRAVALVRNGCPHAVALRILL